jgi:DNA end-binding protein Ku
VPENKVGLGAFAVIRDAMRGKDTVGLGRVVLSRRERVVMLQPRGSGLLGTTLRSPYEVRDEEIYFGDIAEVKIQKDMLALAEHILESKAAKFDSSKFHDRYEAAIVEMINEKKAGLPVSKQRELPRIVAGTDLMSALRQSIEKAKAEGQSPAAQATAKPAASGKGKKAAKRTSASARCSCRSLAARRRSQRQKSRSRRPVRARRRANVNQSLRPRAAPPISGGFFITTKAARFEMANDALGRDGGHVLQRQSLKLSSFGSSNPASNRRL